MSNRYLEGVTPIAPWRAKAAPVLRLLPWLALVCAVMIPVLWFPGAVAAKALGGAAIVLALAWAVRIRRRGDTRSATAAERAALDERAEDVIRAAQRVLSTVSGYGARINAYSMLAKCAELKADFVESAELYALARREAALSTQPGLIALAPALAAREAFAHAAAGDLEAHERALALATRGHAPLGTDAVVARARALALLRRGAKDELRALLEGEESLFAGSLEFRDRELARALDAYANDRPAHPTDDDVRVWVDRVMSRQP